ncbi:PREDICTED: EPIDERMAL PATTERNING FACTOR-like protein 4 [Nelumbo nucifera]|uniref:Epidermal patterning factor-like protein n=1 Tax=Nelumbo nucifera TaxID=4432 RepID=A0A1U7ZVI1_NELNU|nr:PREDICTED: EPIDERMAL PATTERNING FACTOR-like protein 4 [Nelumbo nucifera]
MGVLRHQQLHHHHRLSAAVALALLFIASASATVLSSTRQLGSGLVGVSGVKKPEREEAKKGGGLEVLERLLSRRRLAGPGSSPPTCRSKCGRCSPCKAVHVPIQPGRSIPLEYYPEAWRCKCGNKLFMP